MAKIKIICDSAADIPAETAEKLGIRVMPLWYTFDGENYLADGIDMTKREFFDKMREDISGIIEGPYYKGICDYKDSNVTLKIVAKCKEEDRFQVERDIRRAYRQILVENNIDIAYPQVVLNYPNGKEFESTKETKQKANSFNIEQKELSKHLEDQENN